MRGRGAGERERGVHQRPTCNTGAAGDACAANWRWMVSASAFSWLRRRLIKAPTTATAWSRAVGPSTSRPLSEAAACCACGVVVVVCEKRLCVAWARAEGMFGRRGAHLDGIRREDAVGKGRE